jgi:hypothetical protein
MKYLSYSITLRPCGGIIQEDIKSLCKIIKKYCKYAYAITEKEGEERHIHAALYLNKEKSVSAFNQIMKREFFISVVERESIWGVCYKGKPMYNDSFVNDYLINQVKDGKGKTDKVEVLYENLPPNEKRLEYYKDIVPRKVNRNTGDPYFAKLERMYYEHIEHNELAPDRQPTLQDMEHFICEMMFKHRRIKVITDSRKMRRVCKCLQRYIMKSIGYCWRQGDVENEHGYAA